MSYTISAVDRAFALLEALAENADIGVTELAERTGNTKSLVFRLLYTLEARGYVQKDPATRTYALGYRALYLADHVRQQSRLIVAAQPYLDSLVEETHENVFLVVRDDVHSVCVAMTWVTSDEPMPNEMQPSAPCVEVWLSPHTTVMPGIVRPCSGPMTWTMPWPGSPIG